MSQNNSDPKSPRTIRFSDDEWSRLEEAATKHRKNTGSNETPSGLARTFVLVGLQRFEREGFLTISA